MNEILKRTQNYSGSDLANLAKEAALEPIRSLKPDEICKIDVDAVPAIGYNHFLSALNRIRPSVNLNLLAGYSNWNKSYGDCSI